MTEEQPRNAMIVVQIMCVIWPIFEPELRKLSAKTESTIDDFIIDLASQAIKGICKSG